MEEPSSGLGDADVKIATSAIAGLRRFISDDGIVQRIQLNAHTTHCQDQRYWSQRPEVVKWIVDYFRGEDWEVSSFEKNGFVTLSICAKR